MGHEYRPEDLDQRKTATRIRRAIEARTAAKDASGK